jgi:hypothetical protein
LRGVIFFAIWADILDKANGASVPTDNLKKDLSA